MNRNNGDCILSEVPLNILSAFDPNCKLNATYPGAKMLANSCSSPASNRRPSLAKTYSDAGTMHIIGNSLFISPRQLGDLLSKLPNSAVIPIVDCRSQMDFGAERVRSAHNINCRAKLIARKLIAKRLDEVEPGLLLPFQQSDSIILYDQSTDQTCEEKFQLLPIYLVVQAAKRSDKTVYIVQGGFDAIKRECPYLIECPIQQSSHTDQLPPIPATPDPIDKENLLMSEVSHRIFVGNALDALNSQRLTEYGITHVINATPDLDFCEGRKCKNLRIKIRDHPSENIYEHFEPVTKFIEEALNEKSHKVLVHCSAGISRSPTLVLAYMIKKQHLTLDEALKKMRQYRSIVDPNLSFIVQLRSWEKLCLPKGDPVDGIRSVNAGPIQYANALSHPSSRYCGSTSASKKETKKCTDAPIPVN